MERVPREMAGREQLWLVSLSNYVRMHEYLLRSLVMQLCRENKDRAVVAGEGFWTATI